MRAGAQFSEEHHIHSRESTMLFAKEVDVLVAKPLFVLAIAPNGMGCNSSGCRRGGPLFASCSERS